MVGLKVVHLVSCTARKRAGRRPARDKYAASPWFRDARALAETGDAWHVLSARHLLLDPDDEVGDYEWTMRPRPRTRADGHYWTAAGRRAWARLVADELIARYGLDGDPAQVTFVLLAGADYRRHLAPALRDWGFRVEEPLARVQGVSPQRRWMRDAAQRPTGGARRE